MPRSTITLATDWYSATSASETPLFVPSLARFPRHLRELMAVLPVIDVNRALIEALACRPEGLPGHIVAGVFAVDPFLVGSELASSLRAAGIRRVANFPTVQLYDGVTAASFSMVGYDLAAELALLATFAREGFDAIAYVRSAVATTAAIAAGVGTLAFHGGGATQRAEQAAFRQVSQIASQAGATLLRHRPEPARG